MNETPAAKTAWYPSDLLTAALGVVLSFFLQMRSLIVVRFFADRLAGFLIDLVVILLPALAIAWIVARPKRKPALHGWVFFICVLLAAAFQDHINRMH